MRRVLSGEEAALWARVARTVKPAPGRKVPPAPREVAGRRTENKLGPKSDAVLGRMLSPAALRGSPQPPRVDKLGSHTLDANWDRKLAQGKVSPDFTIDLHGHSLSAAHAQLEHGLALALAQGARLVLLVTGRPRPSEGEGGRGERRGAIRAKFIDWLGHGSHASRIAAIRPAHPRHGGAGAVYLELRRAR